MSFMASRKDKPKWKPRFNGRVPYGSAIDGEVYGPVGLRDQYGRITNDNVNRKSLNVTDEDGIQPQFDRDKKMVELSFTGTDYDDRVDLTPSERAMAAGFERLRTHLLAKQKGALDLRERGSQLYDDLDALREEINAEVDADLNAQQQQDPRGEWHSDPLHAYGTAAEWQYISDGHVKLTKALNALSKRLGGDAKTAKAVHKTIYKTVRKALKDGHLDEDAPEKLARMVSEKIRTHDDEVREQMEKERQEQERQAKEEAKKQAEKEALAERKREEAAEKSDATDAEKRAAERVRAQEQEANRERAEYEARCEAEGRRPDPVFGRGRWGEMETIRPPLQRPQRGKMKVRSPEMYRREEGVVLRFAHRHAIDKQVFAEKMRKNGRVTILLDVSGSMHVPYESVIKVLELSPGATVAAYHGNRERGWLRILAHKGRAVDPSYMPALQEGGGNIVDGPALRWLSKQTGAKIWVCDGHVTGVGDQMTSGLVYDAFSIVRRYNIRHVLDFSDAIGLLESGRALDEQKVTGRRRDIEEATARVSARGY